METLDIWLIAATMMFSLFLLVISLLAYMREREQILLAVSVVFLVFFVKGLVLTLGIFMDSVFDAINGWRFDRIIDLVILLILLLSSWKLPKHRRKEETEVAQQEVLEEPIQEETQEASQEVE